MPDSSKQLPDPRQAIFIKNYLDPSSSTYRNALQSALGAGYTQEYSENILQFDLKWLQAAISEFIGKPTDKKNIANKARLKLDKLLDSADERVVADLTKFVLKTEKEYAEKQDIEISGNITIQSVNYKDADDTNTTQI